MGCQGQRTLSFFSLVFSKIPRKTSKTPRIFSLCEPLKSLENKQKTPQKTKEFRSRKKNTKETKNTKEKKDREKLHVLEVAECTCDERAVLSVLSSRCSRQKVSLRRLHSAQTSLHSPSF